MRSICLTVVAAFLSCVVRSQINTAFSFGSLGSESLSIAPFTGPLAFDGSNECLTLKNGIIVLTKEAKNGVFKLGCRINKVIDPQMITVFPNPLMDHVMLQTDQYSLEEQKLDAIVQDARGRVIFQQVLNGSDLHDGVRINMQSFSNGLYLLKLVSNKQIHVFKLIKTGNLQ